MKRTILLSILLLSGWLQAQEVPLHPGDLLFYTDTGGMGTAVKEATGNYTHVALVVEVTDTVWIIDATPEHGVARRPENSMMHCDVYRLTIPFDTAAVLSHANALTGKSYDNTFLPGNEAYYCSELIQAVFPTLFESKPMNWRDKDGNMPPYWVEHFNRLGIPVPEGVPGTNPTDLSQSPLLKRL